MKFKISRAILILLSFLSCSIVVYGDLAVKITQPPTKPGGYIEVTPGELVTFRAVVTGNKGGPYICYEWDFGGSSVAEPGSTKSEIGDLHRTTQSVTVKFLPAAYGKEIIVLLKVKDQCRNVAVTSLTLKFPPFMEMALNGKTDGSVVVPVNGNFDEQKLNSTGKAQRDHEDESPLDKSATKMILTDLIPFTAIVEESKGKKSDAFYEKAQILLTQEDIPGVPEQSKGMVRVFAVTPNTKTFTVVPFGVDLSKDFYSSKGKYHKLTALYVEGIKPGKVKLKLRLLLEGHEFTKTLEFEVYSQWTKAQWQKVVRDEIYLDNGGKVDIFKYFPANGFNSANRANIQAVFDHYTKIYNESPDNYVWPGLAKMAGAPVYAGLNDAEYGQLFSYLIPFLGTTKPILSKTQKILLQGNLEIFSDLAWQFEAYRTSGFKSLEYIHEVAPLNFDFLPWQKINSGILTSNHDLVHQGNLELLEREQTIIIVQTYHDLDQLGFGSVSWMFSILAQNPVPNGPSFLTVVPNGSISQTQDRWQWIADPNQGMWIIWSSASSTNRTTWVNIPLIKRAEDYSIIHQKTNLPIIK